MNKRKPKSEGPVTATVIVSRDDADSLAWQETKARIADSLRTAGVEPLVSPRSGPDAWDSADSSGQASAAWVVYVPEGKLPALRWHLEQIALRYPPSGLRCWLSRTQAPLVRA